MTSPHRFSSVSWTRFLFSGLSAGALLTASWAAEAAQVADNIAKGRSYEMDPKPRYPIGVVDPDDAVQLTDGKYSDDPAVLFWRNPLTVGWMLAQPPVIIVDLESSRAVTGASYHTAAEHGGVTWPRQVLVFTSDDKEHWTLLGDLVELSEEKEPVQRNAEKTRRYISRKLNGKGRYVAFAVQPEPGKENYVFCDEIEVYGGNPQATEAEAGLKVDGTGLEAIRHTMLKRHVLINIQERLRRDANELESRLASTEKLTAEEKEALRKTLEAIRKEARKLPLPDPATFRAVFPINGLHEQILSLYGGLLQAEGAAKVTVTQQPRYTLPPLFPAAETLQALQARAPVALAVKMLRNEQRADALLLTNGTPERRAVQLVVREKGGKTLTTDEAKGWLKVSAIPWTDTLQLQPVAAALPECSLEEAVELLPGVTTKIWVEVDSTSLPAGVKELEMAVVDSEKEVKVVPLTIEVSPVKMEKPRLGLGMWDYSHSVPGMALTHQNLPAARALMQSHYVNMAWATRKMLPWPEAKAFDTKGQLLEPLDFSPLEQWQKDWPGAKHFCIFIHPGREFAGAAMGSPEFHVRVGSWAKALEEKMTALKLPLVLQLVDEPHQEKHDEIIVAWAKAIQAAAPQLALMENPTWLRPDQTKLQEAITRPNILMPFIVKYLEGGEPVARFFEARRRTGQRLWFYQCAGPIRLLDPTSYFRGQAWWAFQKHGDAINFWAFADTGVGSGNATLTGNSWNEYAGNNLNYSPVFFTPQGVTDSIHWQAVREGVLDFEVLSMLADRMASVENEAWRQRAEALLTSAPDEVLRSASPDSRWHTAEVPAELPDQWRLKAMELLEEAEGLNPQS